MLGRRSRPTESAGEGTFQIVVRDLVVLVDDGKGCLEDYKSLAAVARALGRDCAEGFGLLVIIPSHARPPSDEARRIISETMKNCGSQLKCVCWLVEGRGFQAGMVRAVLSGLSLLARQEFRASVETELLASLRKLYKTLRGSEAFEMQELISTAQYIGRQRLLRGQKSRSA